MVMDPEEQQALDAEPAPSVATNPQEYLLAKWQENVQVKSAYLPRERLTIYTTAAVLVAVFLILAFWVKTWNFGLAGLVVIASVFALLAQNKHLPKARLVQLTNQRLLLDNQTYLLSDLAGFWFDYVDDQLVIVLEHRKPLMVPKSCFYQSNQEEEARKLLTQVLPEVEPRSLQLADKFGRYFRF